VKNTTLSIAAATAFVIAGSTAGLAAELPTFETKGLPISAMQVQVLGAADGIRPVKAALPNEACC
jgi:hypothetical protein